MSSHAFAFPSCGNTGTREMILDVTASGRIWRLSPALARLLQVPRHGLLPCCDRPAALLPCCPGSSSAEAGPGGPRNTHGM